MLNRTGSLLLMVALCALSVTAGGCTALGALASKATVIKVKPQYAGLADQTVAVLVSADSGLRNDFPNLQLDIAGGIVAKLQGAQKAGVEELKGTQFPKDKGPEAVIAFQRNYPTLMYEPMTRIAPKIGASRLIYIEMSDLSTHPESVPELFKGHASARIQVLEVTGGVAKVAHQDQVEVTFPDTIGSGDGLPDLGEAKTYRGTIESFTTAVMQKFVTYEDNR